MMPSSKSSWLAHICGLERLFAFHEPPTAETSTRIGSALLATCRPLLIIGSFFTQKQTVMGEPKWKAKPPPRSPDGTSTSSPTSATAGDLDLLLGFVAEIPLLFTQCDAAIQLIKRSSSPPPPARVSELWARVGHLQQHLQTWHGEWHANHRNEIYESRPITKLNSTHPTPWTTVFYFRSSALAIVFNMYHSAVLLLNSIPTHLLKAGLPDPSSSTPSLLDREPPLPTVKPSIQSICRSIEYYLQFLAPEHAPVDYYLFFPVHVARRACIQHDHAAELAWLEDADSAMKARYRMGVWAKMDFVDRFSGRQEGLFG